MVRHNVLYDLFARFIACNFKPKSQIKADKVYKLVDMHVLWKEIQLLFLNISVNLPVDYA